MLVNHSVVFYFGSPHRLAQRVRRVASLDLTKFFAFSLGMGIVENSTVRFGSRFCFYGSVLSRFPKRFINDISWIRNYAMECVAELA